MPVTMSTPLRPSARELVATARRPLLTPALPRWKRPAETLAEMALKIPLRTTARARPTAHGRAEEAPPRATTTIRIPAVVAGAGAVVAVPLPARRAARARHA